MKPTPPGWPRASSALAYESASAAIDWLTKAFAFELKLKVPGENGRIEHAELEYGGALFMLGDARRERSHRRAPSEIDGVNTQGILVYVDDVEAHCARARAAGAKIVSEPTTHDYGADFWTDRSYECVDLGGHHWWFSERVRTAEKP
jgi:uncharacterized glyoxalase superfamily protein PhnB